MSVGEEVRRRRQEAELSQEALARKASVSTSSIIRIERGETPRLTTLEALATAFGVTAAELMSAPKATA